MKQILLTLLGALVVGSALNPQLSTALAQGTGYRLLTTFTNPTPAYGHCFGVSVAAVGSDRVLIGTAGAGTVYLFSTNGMLLTTFTTPARGGEDDFGRSVAAAGTEGVLIGAPDDSGAAVCSGAAYMYNTNGTLHTCFTNPSPAALGNFGWSVAAVGADRALIGTPKAKTRPRPVGAAYLFRTSGELLTTYTNPEPAACDDRFGHSVAAVGTDRVLIGACGDNTGAKKAGAVYLFSTNGTLLTAFTNPAPAPGDCFGFSVGSVGTDQVLIGAHCDDSGARRAGAAYLFSAQGMLCNSFINPTPVMNDFFGWSVAVVASNRILIGTVGADTVESNVGAAHLFSMGGVMLSIFTNPKPAYAACFGYSIAAVGNDRVLIGACHDNTGAERAGVAYLFSIPLQSPEAPSSVFHPASANSAADRHDGDGTKN